MNKKFGLILLLVSFLIFSGYTFKQTDLYYEISKSIDIFGRVYKEISQKYVDEIDPQEFMLAGIKGMLENLDPYTVYIDESDQKDIDLITTGKYGGIGATIGLRNDNVTVVDLIEGYSAQRQGLRIGDIIVKVDSVDINAVNYEDLSSYMKGEPGTEVSITVKRDGVEGNIIFNLIREEIEIKNLTYYGFAPEESNNVYLKLSGFSRSAGEEIKDAILELENEKKIESIVLDLRGNPGGLLDAAINVTEKFIKKDQLIVKVIGRDSTEVKEYYSDEEPIAGNAKLIVLIDGGSASASEIVAGAIQDHDRGVILGNTSFGKGLVQTVVPLTQETSLKITTARYFTPSGRSIQKNNYLGDSEIFVSPDGINKEEFRTDGNRLVFSGGGIQPDTVVNGTSDSELIRDLIAQGAFFKFATYYFNSENITDWNSIDREELFNSFKEYYEKNKIEFTTRSERLIKELNEIVEDENYGDGLAKELGDFEKALKNLKSRELEKQKKNVIKELHKELAARIDGRIGRIEASLIYDGQFETSLKLISSLEKYDELLAVAN